MASSLGSPELKTLELLKELGHQQVFDRKTNNTAQPSLTSCGITPLAIDEVMKSVYGQNWSSPMTPLAVDEVMKSVYSWHWSGGTLAETPGVGPGGVAETPGGADIAGQGSCEVALEQSPVKCGIWVEGTPFSEPPSLNLERASVRMQAEHLGICVDAATGCGTVGVVLERANLRMLADHMGSCVDAVAGCGTVGVGLERANIRMQADHMGSCVDAAAGCGTVSVGLERGNVRIQAAHGDRSVDAATTLLELSVEEAVEHVTALYARSMLTLGSGLQEESSGSGSSGECSQGPLLDFKMMRGLKEAVAAAEDAFAARPNIALEPTGVQPYPLKNLRERPSPSLSQHENTLARPRHNPSGIAGMLCTGRGGENDDQRYGCSNDMPLSTVELRSVARGSSLACQAVQVARGSGLACQAVQVARGSGLACQAVQVARGSGLACQAVQVARGSGELRIFIMDTKGPTVLINISGAGMYKLNFKPNFSPPAELVTGMDVQITTSAYNMEAREIDVDEFELLQSSGGTKDFKATDAGPYQFSSATFILDLCGTKSETNVSEIEKTWFSRTYNMPGFFDTCSFNNIEFKRQNNIVVGPIQIPCSGTTVEGYNYRTDRCAWEDWVGWISVVKASADRMNLNLSNYRHIVLVIPDKNSPCTFSGSGDYGCRNNCYSFLKSGRMGDIGLATHELGHNMFLAHSGTPLSPDYGDLTSAMGGAIFPDWTTWPDFAFYFSFKAETGYNSDIPSATSNRLTVHMFGGSNTGGTSITQTTELEAVLSLGQMYRSEAQPWAGISAKLMSISGGWANVAVCRSGRSGSDPSCSG
eukprot:gene8102-1348_t